MSDTLVQIGNSVLQHGPSSDRVYALRLDPGQVPEILDDIHELAMSRGYGKVVAKGRRDDVQAFLDRGYQIEATVPRFFGPAQDGVFLSRFLDEDRAQEEDPDRVHQVLEVAREKRVPLDELGETPVAKGTIPGLSVREANPEDARALAACYDAVFDSYPFPIHDPDHLRHEMDKGTEFFTVWDGDSLVAVSSMEDGGAPGAVEMTDFATLPSYRGKGLATRLLTVMDQAANGQGQRVAYTIARAVSFGMNITFARRGYEYGGTLINNTQISGSIESMNVWHKVLTSDG